MLHTNTLANNLGHMHTYETDAVHINCRPNKQRTRKKNRKMVKAKSTTSPSTIDSKCTEIQHINYFRKQINKNDEFFIYSLKYVIVADDGNYLYFLFSVLFLFFVNKKLIEYDSK